jgi:hypothetical protein
MLSSQFFKNLESLLIQRQLEFEINKNEKLSIINKQSIVNLMNHQSFCPILFSHRCPDCKGQLFLSNVDKGIAFVCDKSCIETMFIRNFFY